MVECHDLPASTLILVFHSLVHTVTHAGWNGVRKANPLSGKRVRIQVSGTCALASPSGAGGYVHFYIKSKVGRERLHE